MLILSLISIIFSLYDIESKSLFSNRVVVAGATGYIGRQVVKELVSKGISTLALVRSLSNIPEKTSEYLKGANLKECDVFNESELLMTFIDFQPSSIICCLASRSGIKRDSWAVDYTAGRNLLTAFEQVNNCEENVEGSAENKINKHFVLLSAFCCGKPLLQFQFAKLKLENELRTSQTITHSIVRPTAFFKSLDGQIENVREGLPVLYFGNGECAANPISEKDLAIFLMNCAIDPLRNNMLNQCRDVGGPDVPPISKKNQIELIYNTLNIPIEKRIKISIPLEIFSILLFMFSTMEKISSMLTLQELQLKCEDAIEIIKIVKYYATEPMVAIGENQIQGTTTLSDHFNRIAARGGKLEEIDKMTTTTGVLDLFSRNEYGVTK